MPLLTPAQIVRLRQLLADASMALAISVHGYRASDADMQRLVDDGWIDPADLDNLTLDAFTHGALSSRSAAVRAMTWPQFQAHVRREPWAPGPTEKIAIETAQARAGNDCVGLGNRWSSELGTVLVNADAALEARTRETIRDATATAIERRKTLGALRSDLRQLTQDWGRDWDRIAHTEVHQAHEKGYKEDLRARHGGEAGMAKVPDPQACDSCRALYLDSDGRPAVHPLSWWDAQGENNVGRKKADWKPVSGVVHPFCRCRATSVPPGWGFTDDWELTPSPDEKAVAVGDLRKSGGPYIGPRGGKWADPGHTVPWHETVEAFHGATEEFDHFDPAKQGKRDSGNLGSGVYLTTDSEIARRYADENAGKQGGKPTVLRVHGERLRIADFHAAIPELEAAGFNFPPRAHDEKRSRGIARWFQSHGYDGAQAGHELVIYRPEKLSIRGAVAVPSERARLQLVVEYFREHKRPPPWAGTNPTAPPPWLAKARKLHYRTEFQGLPISIENQKGSIRHWHDPHNNEDGQTKMLHGYGYIRLSEGADGEHIDCYIGSDKDADTAYVVHQMKAPEFKTFDEDKAMLGFPTEAAAREAYLAHYNDPRFLGSITAVPMEKFKRKVEASREHPERMIKADGVLTEGYPWDRDYPNRQVGSGGLMVEGGKRPEHHKHDLAMDVAAVKERMSEAVRETRRPRILFNPRDMERKRKRAKEPPVDAAQARDLPGYAAEDMQAVRGRERNRERVEEDYRRQIEAQETGRETAWWDGAKDA